MEDKNSSIKATFYSLLSVVFLYIIAYALIGEFWRAGVVVVALIAYNTSYSKAIAWTQYTNQRIIREALRLEYEKEKNKTNET